ncbi:MAG: thioredoxin domain-containing protein [Deltaproteobacteria bacterium]|nr:thioredoxin domain-containing protein [Deltaproteobacteria bacterium]
MLKNLGLNSLLLGLLAFNYAGPAQAADADFAKQMDTYLANEANVEKIGNALERYFMKKQQQQQEAQAKSEEAEMDAQFENPVKVEIGSAPIKGKADAAITVVEFSDFQCPYCRRGAGVMEEILKAYPNDVKVAFMNYPLPFHDKAEGAAIAALAAHQQGKFWEMHDQLFANQQTLGDETYIKLAEQLKLDVAKFKADLKSEKLAKQVKDEAEIATKLGVQGTPGYFVNGVQVRGARPLPYFKSIIDKWLAKSAKK